LVHFFVAENSTQPWDLVYEIIEDVIMWDNALFIMDISDSADTRGVTPTGGKYELR